MCYYCTVTWVLELGLSTDDLTLLICSVTRCHGEWTAYIGPQAMPPTPRPPSPARGGCHSSSLETATPDSCSHMATSQGYCPRASTCSPSTQASLSSPRAFPTSSIIRFSRPTLPSCSISSSCLAMKDPPTPTPRPVTPPTPCSLYPAAQGQTTCWGCRGTALSPP